MTQTLSIFLQNIKNRTEQPALPKKHVSLHSFLDRSQSQAKRLSIISVHGSTSLDKQISPAAPQENECIRITHDLQNFHSTPHFDLIFFSSYGSKLNEVKLYEQLSYCRMLLKPGGSICFLVKEDHRHGLLQKMFWKNKVAVTKEDVGGSVNRTITLNVGTGQVKLKISGKGEVML